MWVACAHKWPTVHPFGRYSWGPALMTSILGVVARERAGEGHPAQPSGVGGCRNARWEGGSMWQVGPLMAHLQAVPSAPLLPQPEEGFLVVLNAHGGRQGRWRGKSPKQTEHNTRWVASSILFMRKHTSHEPGASPPPAASGRRSQSVPRLVGHAGLPAGCVRVVAEVSTASFNRQS